MSWSGLGHLDVAGSSEKINVLTGSGSSGGQLHRTTAPMGKGGFCCRGYVKLQRVLSWRKMMGTFGLHETKTRDMCNWCSVQPYKENRFILACTWSQSHGVAPGDGFLLAEAAQVWSHNGRKQHLYERRNS